MDVARGRIMTNPSAMIPAVIIVGPSQQTVVVGHLSRMFLCRLALSRSGVVSCNVILLRQAVSI